MREAASARHRHTHTVIHSSRRTCLRVAPHHTSTNTSHVSDPSGSISPPRHVIDEAGAIFSAPVLCCLCHRPLCDHPPRFSTLVTASLSAEWHGTVYISAKLALPFGPTLLHFRLLADAVIRGRQTGEVNAAGGVGGHFQPANADRMPDGRWIPSPGLFELEFGNLYIAADT